MTTWTRETRASEFGGTAFGSGLFGGGAGWVVESKSSDTWTRELKTNEAGAHAAGPGPAGDTLWTSETKDS